MKKCMFYKVNPTNKHFILLFPVVSWDHICQGSEGSHIANILKSKEIPVDVFFAIGSYAQTILLETLIGEDEAKKLIYHLKECYDLLCVKVRTS